MDARMMAGLLAIVSASMSGCMNVSEPVTLDLDGVTASGIGSSTGSVSISEVDGELTIIIEVQGLTPGEHGVHVHANASCAPGAASATNTTTVAAGAAGSHFNPDNVMHGEHAGDLGNIMVGQDGRGNRTVTDDDLTAALTLKDGETYSIRGRAIVVHAQRDDLMTDPSGNSGGRIACGVIPAS